MKKACLFTQDADQHVTIWHLNACICSLLFWKGQQIKIPPADIQSRSVGRLGPHSWAPVRTIHWANEWWITNRTTSCSYTKEDPESQLRNAQRDRPWSEKRQQYPGAAGGLVAARPAELAKAWAGAVPWGYIHWRAAPKIYVFFFHDDGLGLRHLGLLKQGDVLTKIPRNMVKPVMSCGQECA